MILTGSIVYGPHTSEHTVLEFMGSSSFGTVYRVQEVATGKEFAMKVMSTPSNREDLSTFSNEANLAVKIRHPNVIEYIYFHDGTTYPNLPPYIIMELAQNGSLDSLLSVAKSNAAPLGSEVIISIFRDLAEGMKAINEVLIHRDIKPANILISGETIKISDFGLAKVATDSTRSITFKGGGTFPYIAPEGWRDEKNTILLDIYALGVVFYQLATLRLPFEVNSADPQKWMEAHLYQTPPSPNSLNPAIGPKTAQVIMKMLAKDASKRFQDWSSIIALLEPENSESRVDQKMLHAMLEKRLQQDLELQATEAAATRKAKERSEFCKSIIFQARQTIVDPIIELLEAFNKNYAGAKATFSTSNTESELNFGIQLPSGRRIALDFDVILEENFIREVESIDYGRHRVDKKIVVPFFDGRRVFGWGALIASDNRGFNLVLVERPLELYGDWKILINKANPAYDNDRPNPFAFSELELEKEIPNLGSYGPHTTECRELDLDYILNFVTDYV